MRIIAGSLKSRSIKSPRSNRTHPMSEKIRGAVFAIMGDISGLTVLDAYAGSGALGIEAISRGAASVVAIDNDSTAFQAIQDNILDLGLEAVMTVLRQNINSWSTDNAYETYDIVLIDPPYTDIRPDVVRRLKRHLKPRGLLVLSWPGSEQPLDIPKLTIMSVKSYGDAQLVMYGPHGTT